MHGIVPAKSQTCIETEEFHEYVPTALQRNSGHLCHRFMVCSLHPGFRKTGLGAIVEGGLMSAAQPEAAEALGP